MGISSPATNTSDNVCSKELQKTESNAETEKDQIKENGDNYKKIINKCKTFEDTFDFLMSDIFDDNVPNMSDSITEVVDFKEDMKETWEWLKTVMLYNVPRGKHLRGRLVELSYKGLAREAPEEMIALSRILGWTVEILQACYLVADDIMDAGQLRRGQPCWHRVGNKGIVALNDSFLLEHAAYQVLHKYFRHLPCYTDLLDLCMGITFKTIMGQSLDTRTSLANISQMENHDNAGGAQNIDQLFESYSVELYNSIIRYKTGFYTCYLPVALAMCLAGISRRQSGRLSLWKNVEKVTLEIGHLFQVQDDYFDCFGDERLTGKVGMDCQEGKCTWLFVTAKEALKAKGDEKEYRIFKENYGKCEDACVQRVKQFYKELEIPAKLQAYQEQVVRNIIELIRRLNHSGLEDVLTYFFDVIYKRTC